ncbi:polycomb group RING finger protein 3 isoform X1 [Hypanus sabinus]|uniref:polycomb group RING finger protein 3 isoform X1 n=1 Tax=Hypanus sabinus TaxID=79690 RepID=UPI0028C4C1A0|nr:polycomb group RING finger protein 3 isoform X1 [Hypanus sabinus]
MSPPHLNPAAPPTQVFHTTTQVFRSLPATSHDYTAVLRVRAAQGSKMLTRKIKLWDINAHITCRLCNGYLIDATTVTECLHTFCRSCLVKYLEENNTCPTCRIVIHQSHPLQYIGHDRTMQDIVYKLVPGLQEAELKKQKDFYQKLGLEMPGEVKGETCTAKQLFDTLHDGETKPEDESNKQKMEDKPEEEHDYHRNDEQVSICLECNSSKLRGLKRKWIRCSAQATVLHLKKFIAKKLNLTSFNELDILCNEEILGKDHTLKFVVVTRWRFKGIGSASGAWPSSQIISGSHSPPLCSIT